MWVNYPCIFCPHTNLPKNYKDKINATNFATSKGNKQASAHSFSSSLMTL
jgi:hypothetical protein